jgi:hypothetical protein
MLREWHSEGHQRRKAKVKRHREVNFARFYCSDAITWVLGFFLGARAWLLLALLLGTGWWARWRTRWWAARMIALRLHVERRAVRLKLERL